MGMLATKPSGLLPCPPVGIDGAAQSGISRTPDIRQVGVTVSNGSIADGGEGPQSADSVEKVCRQLFCAHDQN